MAGVIAGSSASRPASNASGGLQAGRRQVRPALGGGQVDEHEAVERLLLAEAAQVRPDGVDLGATALRDDGVARR